MRIIVSNIVAALFSLLFTASAASAASQTPWQNHQGMISTRLLVASPDVGTAFPTRVNGGEIRFFSHGKQNLKTVGKLIGALLVRQAYL